MKHAQKPCVWVCVCVSHTVVICLCVCLCVVSWLHWLHRSFLNTNSSVDEFWVR